MDDVVTDEMKGPDTTCDRTGSSGCLAAAKEATRAAGQGDSEGVVVLEGLEAPSDDRAAAGLACEHAAHGEADRRRRHEYLISALECYAEGAEIERALSIVQTLLDEDRSEEALSRLLPVLLLLPELATQLGRHREAGAAYLAAARHSAMDGEARYEFLVRALGSFQTAGAPEEALKVAQQCVAERPDDQLVTRTTIRLLALLDRRDEAVELLDQNLGRFPDLSRFGGAEGNTLPLSILAGQRARALARRLPGMIAHRLGGLSETRVVRNIEWALDAPLSGKVVDNVCGTVSASVRKSQEAVAVLQDRMLDRMRAVEDHVQRGIEALGAGSQPLREGVARSIGDLRHGDTKQATVLYAFYDLAVSPATFDVLTFLCLAEAERQRTGSTSLHVVVVPGLNEGFRNDTAPYEIEEKRWRLRNIVVPCCWLIPGCLQVSVCSSRDEASAIEASLARKVFPQGYSVSRPKEQYDLKHLTSAAARGVLPSLEASPGARDFVSQWLRREAGERKVVTINLRECGYQQARNSNLGAWGEFARRLDGKRYFPVLVRDMARALDEVPPELNGVALFCEGPWSLELRLALYELSYLNMFVSMGPLALAMLSHKTRYLTFKLITEKVAAISEKYFRERGLEPGSQPPMAGPFQRWVWKDDELEEIESAFGSMCDVIEGARRTGGKFVKGGNGK